MEQETLAAQAIETVGTDPRYDESVKRLLANKSILAVILKECVPEFKHCTTREIAEQYIEGEPQIGEVGIAPDETNRSGGGHSRSEHRGRHLDGGQYPV